MYLERVHPAFLTTLVVLVFFNPSLSQAIYFKVQILFIYYKPLKDNMYIYYWDFKLRKIKHQRYFWVLGQRNSRSCLGVKFFCFCDKFIKTNKLCMRATEIPLFSTFTEIHFFLNNESFTFPWTLVWGLVHSYLHRKLPQYIQIIKARD